MSPRYGRSAVSAAVGIQTPATGGFGGMYGGVGARKPSSVRWTMSRSATDSPSAIPFVFAGPSWIVASDAT